jgi:hypothetical protein
VGDADTAARSETRGVAVGTRDAIGVPARRARSRLLAGDRLGLGPI